MTSWTQLQQTTLTTHQVRRVDQLAIEKYAMNSLVLMENAGRGCVDWILQRFPQPCHATILCGRGNNGGDGLVIARHLQVLGWSCQVIVLGPENRLSADNLANLRVLQQGNRAAPIVVGADEVDQNMIAPDADVIIDAMLGTGASGDPRAPFSHWIEQANARNACRVALDVPTGVCAETGRMGNPAFQPQATLTFVAPKPAMNLEHAANLFGEVSVHSIGIPDALIREVLKLRDQV